MARKGARAAPQLADLMLGHDHKEVRLDGGSVAVCFKTTRRTAEQTRQAQQLPYCIRRPHLNGVKVALYVAGTASSPSFFKVRHVYRGHISHWA
mmetsp:Transcript_28681/g.59950  ORF Transcript_28681/g.59950 Transcript_28681/m.59950 type:complete len:94 (-) Transcript_28681:150-431(-)